VKLCGKISVVACHYSSRLPPSMKSWPDHLPSGNQKRFYEYENL
jgi:hypothetical protein